MRTVHLVGITERWFGPSFKIVTSPYLRRGRLFTFDAKEREIVLNLLGACLVVILLPY